MKFRSRYKEIDKAMKEKEIRRKGELQNGGYDFTFVFSHKLTKTRIIHKKNLQKNCVSVL